MNSQQKNKGLTARLAALYKGITDDFWHTLASLSRARALWLLGGLSALCFELFSYFFYQQYLSLRPCEYCVLIRFCMLIIFLGGLVGAILPSKWYLRLSGFVISLWGALLGLHYTLILENINLDSMSEDFLPICGSGQVNFPLSLPMDEWLPSHFRATGTCGEDSLWSFLDFNMTEWLMMVYIFYILGLLFMFISTILPTSQQEAPGLPRSADQNQTESKK